MNILTHPATAPIAQAICMPTSVINKFAFFASEQLAGSAFPTSLISDIALPIQSITERNLNTYWIAPIAGMAVFTLAATAIYAIPTYLIVTSPLTSFLIIGVASGIHHVAMGFFSNAEDARGLCSFRQSLTDLFLSEDRFLTLNDETFQTIESQAETTKALTFLVSTVALTLFFKNPILANTIAYPLSVVVEIAATRFFLEMALIEGLPAS